MRDLGFLILNDLKKFKNHVLEIIRKPWKLLIFVFYGALLFFMMYTALTTETQATDIPNLVFRQELFSVIINGGVVLLFGYTLYSGTKAFSTLFSMGDVNFLFPSPISSKVILAYSMFQQFLVLIFTSIFFVYIFPMVANAFGEITFGEMIYSLIGVNVLFIITVPFSYLSFILSSRFGLRQWLQYILYGIGIFMLVLLVYGVYQHQNIVEGVFWVLNHELFSYIPIVGWSAHLIGTAVYGISSLSRLFLILQLLTIGISGFFAIYLAEDYYEDVLPTAEKLADNKRRQKEGKKVEVLQSSSSKKVKKVQVKKVGDGPWAFLWMQLVANKRVSGSLIIQWKTMVALIISIAAGLLIPDKSASAFYGIAGGISYLMFLASSDVSIEHELKMKYIFILPGQPWKKILALNIIPVIKTIIFMTCLLLPLGILFGVSFFALLAGLLFPISMFVLNVFSSVIIHILIPSKFDMKAFYPVIRIFSFLLFLIPPGAAGIAVGIRTGSVTLGFYTVAIINIMISMLFLWISDKAFGRLELR